MFTVNNKKVVLSSDDTLDSLKGKISVELNTLPQFLPSSLKIKDGGNYTIKPIFFLENKSIKMGDEDLKLEDIKKQVENDPEQLKKFYIVSKVQTTIDDFGNQPDMAINYAFLELETEFGSLDENVWRNRVSIIQEFEDLIRQNVTTNKKKIQTINVWSKVNPTFNFTSFVMNKINHQTEIQNLNNYNELMVFDSIKLNNVVIGCFYQEMVKYNPEFVRGIDEYLKQDKLLSRKIKASDIVRIMVINPHQRLKYKMINVFVKEDTITFSIETVINQESTVSKTFKNLIKEIILNIGSNEAYSTRQEKDLYYGSYSASISIPTLVLKELATNDPNVYSITYINESALINTRKNNLNIFLKGKNKSTSDHVGVTLFEKPDTVGTLVRIKKLIGGDNLQTQINEGVSIVNKILEYSKSKVEPILKYYQKYISNLKVELKPTEEILNDKETMLKTLVPEIFVSNYTRLCNKPPVIVDKESEMVENELVLKFPIYGESEPKFYKCPYPDYKYPGLRENRTLKNKDIFPFVPCCYQKPQNKSKNFKLYHNQEVYSQRINSGEIGKTLKILSPKRIGVLPPKINNLFLYSIGYKFYRYGSPVTPNSCLEILSMISGNRNTFQTIRSELAQRTELCKGELNHLTPDEISQKLMDPNTYINPRYFKGALEDYYQISFILFSKDKDDFSEYPNKFLKFIWPLKKQVIFLLEHEEQQHTELIVDEETLNYLNRSGKTPIFLFERGDAPVKKMFSLLKDRFKYTLYNIDNKGFENLQNYHDSFSVYPWEKVLGNGKIVTDGGVQPLNQYIDKYGQTRLVEFGNVGNNFVGQFDPLPCLKLPIKSLEYFIEVNSRLNLQQTKNISETFQWCELYLSKLKVETQGYISPYKKFQRLKKLAEYILWASCYAYSNFYLETGDSVDEWIKTSTRVVENFTYSGVEIKPIFNLKELMVDNKFIFSSTQLQDRIKYNLGLISPMNLGLYSTNLYRNFYNDDTNFTVEYPAQLALTRKEYFERTREPYVLNILTTKNLQYLRSNTLYFIRELFGVYESRLCLIVSSLEQIVEKAESYLGLKVVLEETLVNVALFNSNTIETFSIGRKEPQIDILILNVNNGWFYGLLLPN
jgi:hypothetical protein